MVPPKDKAVTLQPNASEELQNAVAQLNRFMNTVTTGLDKQLTRAENIRSQKKILDFTTGASVGTSFPMRFTNELPVRPERISLGQSVALNGGSFAGAVDVSQWDMADGTTIRLNNITGLSANTRYQITLFIE